MGRQGLENKSGWSVEKVTFILVHEDWWNFQGSVEWDKKCITGGNSLSRDQQAEKQSVQSEKSSSNVQKSSEYIEEWGTTGKKDTKLNLAQY